MAPRWMIASMFYQELIFTQDVVSWYAVEIRIVTSPNELRDSEIFKFPWRKLINSFDVNSGQIFPPAELLLYSTIILRFSWKSWPKNIYNQIDNREHALSGANIHTGRCLIVWSGDKNCYEPERITGFGDIEVSVTKINKNVWC